MRVEVRPINVRGKPLPKADRDKFAPSRGRLALSENRVHALGRVVTSATLKSLADGLENLLLPELYDAQVLWLIDTSMRIRGFEDVDGVQYAQTWDIKVLHAQG